MSIFVSAKALEAENRKFKRSSIVMKKTRLPSQYKSKKCSLQEYKKKCMPAKHHVTTGARMLILCDNHFNQWNLRTKKFKPEYQRGNSLDE